MCKHLFDISKQDFLDLLNNSGAVVDPTSVLMLTVKTHERTEHFNLDTSVVTVEIAALERTVLPMRRA